MSFHAKHIVIAGVFFFGLVFQSFGDIKDTLAYKMAILHTQDIFPERRFLGRSTTPADATVSEFQWLLDSIKYRTTNSETEIADTIVEAWSALKQKGHDMTILETARQLSRVTKDTKLFGVDPVNFRVTSYVWLTSVLSGENLETVLRRVLAQSQKQ